MAVTNSTTPWTSNRAMTCMSTSGGQTTEASTPVQRSHSSVLVACGLWCHAGQAHYSTCAASKLPGASVGSVRQASRSIASSCSNCPRSKTLQQELALCAKSDQHNHGKLKYL